jgi:TolB-like protein
VQTIPKQGYLVIAEPHVPDGETQRSEPVAQDPARRAGPKRLAAAVLAVLAVAIGAYTFWPAEPPPAADRAAPLPTGPRIALIPFKNLSEDPDDAFFSEGLTRDINAQLSRFSNLFVIAPRAAEAFRDNPDCDTIREDLQADYILTGTVQRYNQRLRVTTAFQDAETCLQLTPPGPFDRDMSIADVLDIQLEIASKVAAEVGSGDAPLFNVAIQREIRAKAPESLDAYECVLLGYWFYQTFALPEFRKARTCLERAVANEPGYSLAWSRLAFIYLESKKNSYDTPADWSELSLNAANKALAADRDNPDAYYALAIRSRVLGESLGVYREFATRAIDLNPNDSWILADLGIWLAYSGEWVQGKEWITRARALNPRLHLGYSFAWVLHAIVEGNYEEAIEVSLVMRGRLPMNVACLAASYAFLGEQQKAAEAVADLRERFPDYHKDPRAPFRARGMPNELIDRVMEGLELAGYEVPK